MRIKVATVASIACGGLLLMGCTTRESAAPAPPAGTAGATATPAAPPAAPAAPTTPPAANSAPVAQPPTPATPEPKPAEQAPAATSPSPVPPTAAPPSPRSSPPSPPSPVVGAPAVVDPGGPIAVAATKPGLTRVGARKCGVCHKLQLASWTESAHAKRTPPLDCESCHGPGSEYISLAVMKSPQKAKAAGLVQPKAAFCATCHQRGWRDDQLQRAHAHKAPSGS